MNIFKRLFGARAQYILLNAREEEFKSKRKRLGIQSIILSVIGLIGVIVFVIIGTLLARNVATSTVGEISNAPITSFFGAIVFYAFALSFANYQRHLNKKQNWNCKFNNKFSFNTNMPIIHNHICCNYVIMKKSP